MGLPVGRRKRQQLDNLLRRFGPDVVGNVDENNPPEGESFWAVICEGGFNPHSWSELTEMPSGSLRIREGGRSGEGNLYEVHNNEIKAGTAVRVWYAEGGTPGVHDLWFCDAATLVTRPIDCEKTDQDPDDPPADPDDPTPDDPDDPPCRFTGQICSITNLTIDCVDGVVTYDYDEVCYDVVDGVIMTTCPTED